MKRVYNVVCMNKMTPPYKVYASSREEALDILADHLCGDKSKIIKGNQGTFNFMEVMGMKFIAKESEENE